MAKKKFFTFNELAELYGKDPSYIAKQAREFKLVVTPAVSNGHPCSALSLEEKEKLEAKNKNLTFPQIKKGEQEVNDLAKKRKQDVSGLLKLLKANGFTLEKRLRKGGGRPVNVISAKDSERLDKEFPVRIKV